MMASQAKPFYEFGNFRLDPQRCRLYREGELIPLSRKDIETLIVLVQNRGTVLTREELLQSVWNGTFVEDASLTVAISHLRKALEQKTEVEGYIETIPRKGYCFTADVREIYEDTPPLILEKLTLSTTVIEEEFTSASDIARANSSQPQVRTTSSRPTTMGLMLTLAFGVLLIGSVYVLFRVSNSAAGKVNSGVRSIAVVPPRTQNTDADNSSLSLGFANGVTARFVNLNNLSVRTVTATKQNSSSSEDSLALGRKLNVDAILDGHLDHSSNKVQISLRLLDTRTGNALWEGEFEETPERLLHLEDQAAQAIASALSLKLTANEQSSLTKHLTTNHEAYAEYLKGNYYWSQRGDFTAKSIPHYGKAIELDPQFAEAYLGLANVYAVGGRWTESRLLIDKALALNPTLGEAHATYAFISMFQNWQWESAETALDRAIQLNPNSAHVHHWKGVYLSLRGRIDEAKQEMQRALELDPYSLIITADLGQLHYFAREYDQAIEYCNRALALDDGFQLARLYLADIYLMQGQEQLAFDVWYRLNYLDGRSEGKQYKDIFTKRGWRGVLTAELNIKHNPNDPRVKEPPAIHVARLQVGLGNGEQALRYLEKSFEEHAFMLPFINVDPYYDSLRQHPRFQSIVRRMGL